MFSVHHTYSDELVSLLNTVYSFQVSPIKLRRDGAIKLKFLSLIDGPNQKACKVALFNKDTETHFRESDVIKISNVYGWRKQGSNNPPSSFGTKPTSEIEAFVLFLFI